MAEGRVERRLAAILAGDVAGYSRLMGADEEGTLLRLNAHRHEFLDPKISEHRGRIVKRTGDGILIEFGSVVDAARCAIEIQRGMNERNAPVAQDERIELRIGIHIGDIITEEGDIFGDGVNIAARLEGIAQPGGICLSDDAYRQVRGKLEADFQDAGEQQLKNIARPVRIYRFQRVAAEAATPPLPDRPSIAVLPFQNMSGDPEQDYFADGMVEDIITGLSRVRWLFVIARNSSFTYKGRAVDVTQVGRELGVRYVLEGSVRKAGARVRITSQLIDASTGRHLWAERFDRDLQDVFALQDEITMNVVASIEPNVRQAEIERVKRKRPENLDAYDLVLRAIPHASAATPEEASQALVLLERAIALEPDYALAHAFAAWCCEQRFVRGDHREDDRLKGVAHARLVLATSSDDATALGLAGFILWMLAHDRTAALDAMNRALVISPSSLMTLMYGAVALAFMGETALAIERAQLALRLSPMDPLRWGALSAIAIAHLLDGRYEEAAEFARRTVQLNPGFSSGLAFLAGALARSGRESEARDVAARLLIMEPAFSSRGIAALAYGEELQRKLLDAFAAANLPS
jgi:adenylate cyclase